MFIVTGLSGFGACGVLWTPERIGPQGWYDAGLSGKTLSGNEVSQWDDLSGNGRHASQGTSANRPLYDSSGNWLSFDGSNDRLVASSSWIGSGNSAWTYAFVAYPKTTSGARIAVAQGNASANQMPYLGFSGTSYINGAYTNNYTIGTFSASNWYILVGRYTTSARDIYSNGSLVGTQSYSSGNWGTANPSIGSAADGTSFFSGYIRSVLTFNSALSSDDREKLEGYLAHRWGIALASGHPYKDNPPYI